MSLSLSLSLSFLLCVVARVVLVMCVFVCVRVVCMRMYAVCYDLDIAFFIFPPVAAFPDECAISEGLRPRNTFQYGLRHRDRKQTVSMFIYKHVQIAACLYCRSVLTFYLTGAKDIFRCYITTGNCCIGIYPSPLFKLETATYNMNKI